MFAKADNSEVPGAKPRKPRSLLKPMNRDSSRSVSPAPRCLGVGKRSTSISPSRFRRSDESWQKFDKSSDEEIQIRVKPPLPPKPQSRLRKSLISVFDQEQNSNNEIQPPKQDFRKSNEGIQLKSRSSNPISNRSSEVESSEIRLRSRSPRISNTSENDGIGSESNESSEEKTETSVMDMIRKKLPGPISSKMVGIITKNRIKI